MNKITHQFLTRIFIGISFAFVLIITLQSCFPSSRFVEQNDVVYSSKRIEFNYSQRIKDRHSPLFYFKQSIVKEILPSGVNTYNVYDVLYLSSSSFKLENKAFIIVDGTAFKVDIVTSEIEHTKTISEDTDTILTADSTSVTVVTGYTESRQKITKFNYCFSDDIVNRIKDSQEVIYRYYAGPSMISVKLDYSKLNSLKSLIAKQ